MATTTTVNIWVTTQHSPPLSPSSKQLARRTSRFFWTDRQREFPILLSLVHQQLSRSPVSQHIQLLLPIWNSFATSSVQRSTMSNILPLVDLALLQPFQELFGQEMLHLMCHLSLLQLRTTSISMVSMRTAISCSHSRLL